MHIESGYRIRNMQSPVEFSVRRLQRLFLYIAIVLMPFQDTILGRSPLGYVGSNLSSIPMMIHGMLGFFVWLRQGRLTISLRNLSTWLYVLLISMVYLIAWGPVSHGGSVVYKALSGAIVVFLWVYTVFFVNYAPSRGLRRATYIAFAILIIGVVISDANIPGLDGLSQSQFLHITPIQGYARWRGFSNEPSIFSATVVSLGIVAAYLSMHKTTRNLIIALALLLLIFSQSKGGLLVFAISGVVYLLIKRPNFIRLVAYTVLGGVAAVPLAYLLIQQESALDLSQGSITFATRISMGIWAFIVVAHHPFGVGLSGFFEAIRIYLPTAMDYVDRISPIALNFAEVQEYVNGNMLLVPLDAKCFFLEYVAMFGMPFIIAYCRFSWLVLKALLQRRQELLAVGFIFLLIAMSTYVNGLTLYAGFYLAGTCYRQRLLFAVINLKKSQAEANLNLQRLSIGV